MKFGVHNIWTYSQKYAILKIHSFCCLVTEKCNLCLLEEPMNRSFRKKVKTNKPPRDPYTPLGAFAFREVIPWPQRITNVS
jgi:hypothetical protein